MSTKTWNDFFAKQKEERYFIELNAFLNRIYDEEIVYPLRADVFRAFALTPYEKVKVVIFGQDPYINEGEATGLAFSIGKTAKIPPSLRNIYKEIENNIGKPTVKDGNLEYLATQGVLLLNPILTVRKGASLSHDYSFYTELTKRLIAFLNEKDTLAYMFWGRRAQKFKKYVTNPTHLILEATHPSPLGANRGGFFGTNHFTKTNEYLVKHDKEPINWQKYMPH